VCKETGFSGVQIHSAHGYLLSNFLNPNGNKRDDSYGGDLENRCRLLLEVVRAVRAAVGAEYPIGVKLNSSDFQKGVRVTLVCLFHFWMLYLRIRKRLSQQGFTHEEAMAVAEMLDTVSWPSSSLLFHTRRAQEPAANVFSHLIRRALTCSRSAAATSTCVCVCVVCACVCVVMMFNACANSIP
jgi:2,4-dienoyl-CoA reductase-like NADH-dependent reductase (Old Yellow Enzyme family)